MKWFVGASPAASLASAGDAQQAVDFSKYKLLVASIASSWLFGLGLALLHVVLCVYLVAEKCELGVAQLNAQCAGVLVAFGCFQSLCATLVGPLRVVHAFLHRNVSVIKQGSSALSIFVALGVVVSGIALLLMPLRGFYVCLGAVVCKQHARSLYVATVVLSCVDSFFACAVFWSLVRGRNLEALSEPGKRAAKTVKLNAPQKLPSEKAA